MKAQSQSKKKFQELILYVSRECENDPKFGATKLNKLLFYADFLAYRQLGHSISGQEYQKLEYGPAPRHLKPEVKRLQAANHFAWANRNYFGRQQKRPIALRDADLSQFSAEEIHLVHSVIDELQDFNGTEVSDLSHRFPGWQVMDLNETIPYSTAFISEPTPLSEAEQIYAQRVIREYLEQEA